MNRTVSTCNFDGFDIFINCKLYGITVLILCITVNDIEIQNRFVDLLCKTKHEHYFLTIKSLTVRNILFPIILYQSNIGVLSLCSIRNKDNTGIYFSFKNGIFRQFDWNDTEKLVTIAIDQKPA